MKNTLQYDHVGIIIDKPKEGMRYFPEFKLWTSDYTKSPWSDFKSNL